MTIHPLFAYNKLHQPTTLIKNNSIVVHLLYYVACLFIIIGLIYGLFIINADITQGESSKIMYVHVPFAWITILLYSTLAVFSSIYIVWSMPFVYLYSVAIAIVGLIFNLLTLITGSLWGYPAWGTFWVWDARLTSVLFLAFLFFGFIAIHYLYPMDTSANKAAAFVAVIGFINIPIIKYSVEWWNTLHQGSSVNQLASAIDTHMLLPMLLILIGYSLFCYYIIIRIMRIQLLSRKHDAILKETAFRLNTK